MGSLLDGIPRKYFNISTDHSQSLKSNPHTTENCLLHLPPFSLKKKRKSTCISLSRWQPRAGHPAQQAVSGTRRVELQVPLLCLSSGSRPGATNLCLDPEWNIELQSSAGCGMSWLGFSILCGLVGSDLCWVKVIHSSGSSQVEGGFLCRPFEGGMFNKGFDLI